MRSMLSANRRNVFPPSDCNSVNKVLIRAPSYFAPRTFRKSLRQDRPTTRVLVIGQRSRVLFKCATAATHCATLVVHARDPFPVSAYVRCRLEKSPSFSFCQVDMYDNCFASLYVSVIRALILFVTSRAINCQHQ